MTTKYATTDTNIIDLLEATKLVLETANVDHEQISRVLDKICEERLGFSALAKADIEPKTSTSNVWCTVTQIGALCEPRLTGIAVNHLLQIGGYQTLVNSIYQPLPKADGLHLVIHDGRFDEQDNPITDILWRPVIADIVQELAKQNNS